MMDIFKNSVVKRKLICVVLGILFGLLCSFLASQSDPSIWGTPAMWGIIFNRVLIGLFVFMGGFFTYHCCLKIRIYSWIRGFFIGALVSFDLAIWNLMIPNMTAAEQWTIFWLTIISGGIYGLIIDVIASRYAGEGEKLMNGLKECMVKK